MIRKKKRENLIACTRMICVKTRGKIIMRLLKEEFWEI
jgi:hypothetical protein